MSDHLAASLERLHNARQQSPSPHVTRNLGATASTTDDELDWQPAPEPDWVAAAQGRLAALDDAHHGKPRIALGLRAALAGVFALLALGGGIVSAHLLTANAEPITIATKQVPDGEAPTTPMPDGAENSGLAGSIGLPEDGGAAAGEAVVVHVAGAVSQPGIVELPPGSRVAKAVDLAGGALPEADLGAVNLARVVVDGEQIKIPLIGEAPAAATPASAPEQPLAPTIDLTQSRDEAGRINLNQASSALLQQLPGIGPALAGRIIEYRAQVGGFTSIDQLQEVSGIGPAVMNNVRDQVSV